MTTKPTPIFTVDWFTNNIPLWNKYFKKLQDIQISALEIGSFEGRSSIWMIENVLKHKKSKLTCIDNFELSPSALKTFQTNIKPYGKKIKLLVGNSSEVLKKPTMLKTKFDFIYIDAGHHSKNVLEDAILSFPLLNEGGYMVFDDYTTNDKHDYTCPKKGIDAFLDVYANEIKVIHSRWQVILVKVSPKRKVKSCKSEFYV
jgi:predicted O-methyltransferase YrrM